MKEVGEQRAHRKNDSQKIQPTGSAYRLGTLTIVGAELGENCGQADGCDDHNGERTAKGDGLGIDDDQCQQATKDPRRYDGPAARLWFRIVRSSVGQPFIVATAYAGIHSALRVAPEFTA